MFDQHVLLKLQRGLLRAVLENYKAASSHCYSNFQPPQAKDLSGDYRRAKIEDEWAGIAAIFEDIKVNVRQYENNTGSYNEITCGQVKITQSCTLSANFVPRFALFRETLASNGQRDLFEGDEPQDCEGEERFLYAIFTHGVDVSSPKRSRPYFAKVQFPNENCTSYVDEGLDLFKRFPELTAEYLPGKAPEINPNRRQKRESGTA